MTSPTIVHDLGDGCPPDSAEHWRDLHAAVSRELSKVTNREMASLMDEVKRERSVRAAAKRAAWDHALFAVRLYVYSEARRPLDDLIGDVLGLPEKPNDRQVHNAQWSARILRDAINELADVEPTGGPLVAEVQRLRAALYKQGARLHRERGISTGERCECAGCELTRASELHETAKDGDQ